MRSPLTSKPRKEKKSNICNHLLLTWIDSRLQFSELLGDILDSFLVYQRIAVVSL